MERNPVRMQRIKDMTQAYCDVQQLTELRLQGDLTELDVEIAFEVSKSTSSRTEHLGGAYLSTLRAYIEGLGLGQPFVERIRNSRHHNMKELRPVASGNLRVLLAFDPRRHAILLI